MKKLLVLVALIFTPFIYSQTINDVPIKDIDVDYIQIVGTSRLMSDKVTIEIDFGQDTKFFDFKDEKRIKDVEGKSLKFNSMIDALNFWVANGYSFVQAYAFSVGSNQNVYHYLLRKNK